MSTFNGLVVEFPDIRVDFFRRISGKRSPLVCFLSHVHSDHLAGLDSLRSPFVYCSAATRELLLRLERIPCRINYARGILEARVQTYKHLKNILKPIPLQTATVLELAPGNTIQVTLFDANHCPGATMFLFEGQGKAVLYTGDIRSEPWFVNALTRSPSMVQYAYGLKTLDKIYLDTSFIDDVPFQLKAEGIRELLQKVGRYPPDTIFHIQAWTYGYEDVWIALSKALQSKIHVDEYKMRVYRSLMSKDEKNRFGAQFHMAPEAPSLVGFMCGNSQHDGCLTMDEKVRLHSCEKGVYCSTVQNSPVVFIQPIVAHLANGQDITELGVGGGGDDLERDAELEYLGPGEVSELLEVICDTDAISDELKENMRLFLLNAVAAGRNVSLDMGLSLLGEQNEILLSNASRAIANTAERKRQTYRSRDADAPISLPKTVTFPYARHSSYPELCHLVSAFKPKDVWPCTVSPREWLEAGVSIKKLFGDHCSGTVFDHDQMLESLVIESTKERINKVSQTNTSSFETAVEKQASTQRIVKSMGGADPIPTGSQTGDTLRPNANTHEMHLDDELEIQEMSQRELMPDQPEEEAANIDFVENDLRQGSQATDTSQSLLGLRAQAYESILGNTTSSAWAPIGLISTSDHHTILDEELGEC